MKIIKKFLYGVLIIFVLLSGFIMVCAMKPELSGQIAKTLKLDEIGNSPYASDIVIRSENDNNVASVSSNQIQTISVAEVTPETPTPQYETRPTGVVWADERKDDDDASQVDMSLFGISVPADVAGKNGYEPVKGDNSQIGDEEAEQLRSELGFGETGDSLRFDSRFYPYYYMLDAKGQHLYRQIYANANALKDRFAPVENVSLNELKNTFEAVYNDHPELFWVDTAYSCKYGSNGQCAEIDLQFNYTADNLSSEKTTFNQKAKEIIDEARKLGTDYEKEIYVHDQLISKIEYVDFAKINQSAYSALVNNRTVCAGYARAFQYIMQQMGIPCYYCTGYAGESHAWNITALDDGYYNVDVTWDDTGSGTYDYFNKSDADFSWNHLRQSLSVNLPPCNGMKYRNQEENDNDENGGSNNDDGTENKEEDYDSRRSIADLRYSNGNAITTLQEYYNDCYRNIVSRGKGSYTFSNLVYGDSMFSTVYGAYQSNDYRQGYMDSAMLQLDASLYRINWQIEALRDNYYLITHDVAIQ